MSQNQHHHVGRRDESRQPSLRQRMSRDLQLRAMAERTHDGYLREVRELTACYNTPPDQLTEQQIGEYLLHLINDCSFAPGSPGVAYIGIKGVYTVPCLATGKCSRSSAAPGRRRSPRQSK